MTSTALGIGTTDRSVGRIVDDLVISYNQISYLTDNPEGGPARLDHAGEAYSDLAEASPRIGSAFELVPGLWLGDPATRVRAG